MAATGGSRTKSSGNRVKTKASSRSNSGSPAKQRPKSASRRRRQAPAARRPTRDGRTAVEKAAAIREDVQHSVQHSARDTGQALSKAAKKAKSYGKTPILMGGTALAGAAGGLALGARRNRPLKVLGVEVPRNGVHVKSRDIVRTARQAGKLTETAGHIAAELRQANERSNGKPRLSPIEVVLRGLTSRR